MTGRDRMGNTTAKRPRKSPGRTASKGFPNPIDVHVGSPIRLRRMLLEDQPIHPGRGDRAYIPAGAEIREGNNRVSSSRLVAGELLVLAHSAEIGFEVDADECRPTGQSNPRRGREYRQRYFRNHPRGLEGTP